MELELLYRKSTEACPELKDLLTYCDDAIIIETVSPGYICYRNNYFVLHTTIIPVHYLYSEIMVELIRIGNEYRKLKKFKAILEPLLTDFECSFPIPFDNPEGSFEVYLIVDTKILFFCFDSETEEWEFCDNNWVLWKPFNQDFKDCLTEVITECLKDNKEFRSRHLSEEYLEIPPEISASSSLVSRVATIVNLQTNLLTN